MSRFDTEQIPGLLDQHNENPIDDTEVIPEFELDDPKSAPMQNPLRIHQPKHIIGLIRKHRGIIMIIAIIIILVGALGVAIYFSIKGSQDIDSSIKTLNDGKTQIGESLKLSDVAHNQASDDLKKLADAHVDATTDWKQIDDALAKISTAAHALCDAIPRR